MLASDDVGSPELASALRERDPVELARALREGWVIVPTTRAGAGVELRLFGGLHDAREGWELPLFSSTAQLHAFLADDPAREFEFVRAASLADFLTTSRDTIARVVFDPASEFAVAASVDDVLDAIASPKSDPVPVARGIAADDRALDLELPLDDGWFRIDLTDHAARDARIAELVDRQLEGLDAGPMLRSQLAQWLRRMVRVADGGHGRETAFLLRRTENAALALAMTRYWQRLGAPTNGRDHLDVLADRLRASADPGEMVTAQTPTGRLLRRTRTTQGSAELRAEDTAVLTIDYWLEFPDLRGLCLVSFSTPHADLRPVIAELTDEIVLASVWVVAGQEAAAR
ncbi:hypothetical protein OB08_04255 [Microbacterium sp. HJ5]